MNDIIKWIDIAQSDIQSSKVLLDNKCYSQSYFYFQQATEKANKSNWMLSNLLTENELKKVSHNQFKPYRKAVKEQQDKFEELKTLSENNKILQESPLFKNFDLNDYENNLSEGLKGLDKLYNTNLFDLEESDLLEFNKMLDELKNYEFNLPSNFNDTIRQNLYEYITWLKKINTDTSIEIHSELSKCLNDEIEFQNLLNEVKNYLESIINITYPNYTLYYCSILTVQHSNTTRYPQNLDGLSPLDVYNENLNIIKYQNYFLNHLSESLSILREFAQNTPQIKEKKPAQEKQTNDKFKEEIPLPDSTWNAFGIKSKKDFINTFFVAKKTHSKVPKNVSKEMKKSEQLQSFSYYFYPMYGDAFSRLTRIFEIAVKSKAKMEGLKFDNKKSLKQLIDKTFVKYDKSFRSNLNWARLMRNTAAHPDSNTIHGNFLRLPLVRMTNIINDIFRDASYFEHQKEKIKKIKADFKSFRNGLWHFDKYLIHSIKIVTVKNGVSLWELHPVLIDYPQKKEDIVINNPFYLILTEFKKDGSNFIGKDIQGSYLELISCNSKINLDKLINYKTQLSSSPNEVKEIINHVSLQYKFLQIEEFYHRVN